MLNEACQGVSLVHSPPGGFDQIHHGVTINLLGEPSNNSTHTAQKEKCAFQAIAV